MLRHCRYVGGQKQYIFSPLGNKIYFHAKLFHFSALQHGCREDKRQTLLNWETLQCKNLPKDVNRTITKLTKPKHPLNRTLLRQI